MTYSTMYNLALDMGCPDAYIVLAQCHENGWGVRADSEIAIDLLEKGAEAGSPKRVEFYGAHLIREEGRIEEGRRWLRRAIDIGNGDAGKSLAESYAAENNAEGIIQALRDGARQGSKECLAQLEMTYKHGHYWQRKDIDHAACYGRLYDTIDDFDAPEPIKDFDKLCPLPPIQPYRDR